MSGSNIWHDFSSLLSLGDAAHLVPGDTDCGLEKKAVHDRPVFSKLSRFHGIHVRNNVYGCVFAFTDPVLLGSPVGNSRRIHPGIVGLLRNPQSFGLFAFIVGTGVPTIAAVDPSHAHTSRSWAFCNAPGNSPGSPDQILFRVRFLSVPDRDWPVVWFIVVHSHSGNLMA